MKIFEPYRQKSMKIRIKLLQHYNFVQIMGKYVIFVELYMECDVLFLTLKGNISYKNVYNISMYNFRIQSKKSKFSVNHESVPCSQMDLVKIIYCRPGEHFAKCSVQQMTDLVHVVCLFFCGIMWGETLLGFFCWFLLKKLFFVFWFRLFCFVLLCFFFFGFFVVCFFVDVALCSVVRYKGTHNVSHKRSKLYVSEWTWLKLAEIRRKPTRCSLIYVFPVSSGEFDVNRLVPICYRMSGTTFHSILRNCIVNETSSTNCQQCHSWTQMILTLLLPFCPTTLKLILLFLILQLVFSFVSLQYEPLWSKYDRFITVLLYLKIIVIYAL